MNTANKQSLAIRRVEIEALFLDPANVRLHSERNLDAIKASLQRFGQAEPLVIHAGSGKVIGGNGRLEAMRSLGWTECDVVELDIDEVTSTALGIALNRTAELAEWDLPALGALLESLKAEGESVATGFDDAEIQEMLDEISGGAGNVAAKDPGPGELPAEPTTRAGECWILGRHRLVCGDSTSAATFDQLLRGEKAAHLLCDPPYGVSYVGGTKDKLTIENDSLAPDELEEFLGAVFSHALNSCEPGAAWYVCAPAGPQFLQFAKRLDALGVWRQTLVWLKDAFVLGRSDFHYRHEAIFYGWVPGAAHHAPSTRTLDTILEFPRPRVSKDHPTEKPLALVQHCIETSSDRNAIVLDPFAGSGTTLIAAEACGRIARVIELDPRYADVVIYRWQEATGEQATLETDGQTFQQVAAERKPDEATTDD